jgi:XTP/dITP diphosphohydrolase
MNAAPAHRRPSEGADRRIVLATGNAGKAAEIRAILGDLGYPLLSLTEAGVSAPPVVETGRSYAENAIAKAVAIVNASGFAALADDSGIEVDALDGRPGVLSARFGGMRARTDADRVRLLLEMLDGVPMARRTARFRCVVAFAVAGNRTATREGVVEGRIALEPRGSSGFGYDPVFLLPDGRTMAEVGEEKQRISHRAQALAAMREVIPTLVG